MAPHRGIGMIPNSAPVYEGIDVLHRGIPGMGWTPGHARMGGVCTGRISDQEFAALPTVGGCTYEVVSEPAPWASCGAAPVLGPAPLVDHGSPTLRCPDSESNRGAAPLEGFSLPLRYQGTTSRMKRKDPL